MFLSSVLRFEFWYISSPYVAKQQRDMTKFKVFSTLTPFQPVFQRDISATLYNFYEFE